MSERKRRILHVGESSYLSTGYSTMAAEMLKRLHATGEFEVCELGCFGQFGHPAEQSIPWKFVSAMPHPSDAAAVEAYSKNTTNRFGAQVFEQVCLDFKPDVVFMWRDWWNDEFLFRSPFRRHYHLAHMATVDAEPLDEQWVASYRTADAMFGYTDWGVDVLRRHGVNALGSAPAGADFDVFKPVPDRRSYQQGMGLPKDALVIGFVSRNQKRKLFVELIEAFARMLSEGPEIIRKNAHLLLHTCYPETCPHWDIPRALRDCGVGHRVLFTYACTSCDAVFPSPYRDAVAPCQSCGRRSALMPDPSRGVSRSVLAGVYNMMDLYVQFALAEGQGLSQAEAAACGIPVMATDYSAMADVVRKLEGFPIRVHRYVREAETHRLFGYPDADDFVRQAVRLLTAPHSYRANLGMKAREAAKRHYCWDRTAKIWADHFQSVPLREEIETWRSPPRLHEPNTKAPDGLSDDDWVRWCFAHVLGRPEESDSFAALRMMRDLGWGTTSGGMGGGVFNDASALGLELEPQKTKFDRTKALEQMLTTVNHANHWELRRGEAN